MKSILILGGGSLVGSTLIKYMKTDFKVTATYNEFKPKIEIPLIRLNLLEGKEKISEIINKINPDIVINTIALPSVDECEENHKIADNLHVKAVEHLNEICKKNNVKLFQFSTDAVFEGNKIKKYSEIDYPNPINYYGKTRLEAEKIVLNNSSSNVVLRTAVIYGAHPRSRFSNWIIETLSKNKIVDPHNDQYNTPTLVDDLAKAIIKIIQKNSKGLFHAVGKNCCSRYELAIKIADIFGFNKSLIKGVTSEEKKQSAPRPKKTCLNATKLEKEIEFNFSTIEEGIFFIYNQFKDRK